MRLLDPKLAERRKDRILQWVVHRYIRTGKPIGSETLSEQSEIDLSSATIRHIMAKLEEEGYLAHPHTSAGRIPTDKGYRYYVDYLMRTQQLAAEERGRIQKEYHSRLQELDDLLLKTSRTLSSVSHYAGFVLSPKFDQDILKHIELIPIAPQRYMVLMISQSGLVRHKQVETTLSIPSQRLPTINRFLNENLGGLSLGAARNTLLSQLETAEKRFQELNDLIKNLTREVLENEDPKELYIEGGENILRLPEIHEFEALHAFMEVLEEKKRLIHILRQDLNPNRKLPRVKVRICVENPLPGLQHLSLVTSTYELDGKPLGLLGILGPKHMPYAKMVALVDFIGRNVNHFLEQWKEIPTR